LLQQVVAAWQTGKGVASLLSLDMTGAFDRVVPSRLLHNLRKRQVPEWIVSYISSFISQRSTSLCLPGSSSAQLPTQNGIPQGSPLSPVLFLFYNADLVEFCNPPDLPASAIGFVDDVNPLAFGISTEETCETLEILHERCLKWSDMHGAEFAPKKYTLVHLAKQRSTPTTPLHLRNVTLHPSTSACILGLIIDSKLSWRPHVAAIKAKMRTQTYVLTKLTASTWGAPLSTAHLLYTSIVCPILTKASTAWHSPVGTPFARKWLLKELSPFHNSCLRAISGAYKATPIRNLEVEVGVPPLGIT
jgi:hypothetical protein